MEARHSFTTQVARRQGMEFAQEALGHPTLATYSKITGPDFKVKPKKK